jgi:hypothetical protein
VREVGIEGGTQRTVRSTAREEKKASKHTSQRDEYMELVQECERFLSKREA